MKKLKLDPESLVVETFRPAESGELRGTVEANGYPYTDEAIGTCTCTTTRNCTAAITCDYTCFMIDTCEPGVCW